MVQGSMQALMRHLQLLHCSYYTAKHPPPKQLKLIDDTGLVSHSHSLTHVRIVRDSLYFNRSRGSITPGLWLSGSVTRTTPASFCTPF